VPRKNSDIKNSLNDGFCAKVRGGDGFSKANSAALIKPPQKLANNKIAQTEITIIISSPDTFGKSFYQIIKIYNMIMDSEIWQNTKDGIYSATVLGRFISSGPVKN